MLSKIICAIAIITVSMVGLALANPDQHEEANIALMKKFYEEVPNKGNFAFIDEAVSENVIEHEQLPGLEPNREGVKKFFTMFRAAFPDLHFEVDMIFAADDKVVAAITVTGTHKSEWMGMPATGKKINFKAIDIVRFADGKAVEHWGITDNLTMMQQLGAVPSETTAK